MALDIVSKFADQAVPYADLAAHRGDLAPWKTSERIFGDLERLASLPSLGLHATLRHIRLVPDEHGDIARYDVIDYALLPCPQDSQEIRPYGPFSFTPGGLRPF